jgi:predicted  nucleic acid-binding Zn-ribbon protein
MSVTADVLRELHRIHRQLSDLRERRERGPKQVRAHEANLKRLDEALNKVKGDALAARKNVDNKQLQLRSLEDKLNTLKNRLSQCSTNREYQAIQEQISADKVASSVLEDEILDALGKVDESKVLVVTAEQNVAKAKEEFEKVRRQVEDQRQTIEGDLGRLEAALKEVEGRLSPEFRRDYDRVVKARGQEALAPAEGEVCGGCYQQLTPNMLSQLKMGQAIFCKSCGRLLYLPEGK